MCFIWTKLCSSSTWMAWNTSSKSLLCWQYFKILGSPIKNKLNFLIWNPIWSNVFVIGSVDGRYLVKPKFWQSPINSVVIWTENGTKKNFDLDTPRKYIFHFKQKLHQRMQLFSCFEPHFPETSCWHSATAQHSPQHKPKKADIKSNT